MSATVPLSRRLSERVVVLDGGLSTALDAAGVDLQDELWTARLLAEDPDALVAAHRSFLEAGAEVVITASYQASIDAFRRRLGCSGDEAAAVVASSVTLARRATGDVDRQAPVPLVAASIGPYGAVLADGSEYVGRYELDVAALVDFHAERFAVLAAERPDVMACETIPCVAEAEALGHLLGGADLAAVAPVDAWVSFCCGPAGRLVSGEDVADAARAVLRGGGPVVALGVNCTAPAHVAAALDRLRRVTSLPLVAYPNLGRVWDATAKQWRGEVPSTTDHRATADPAAAALTAAPSTAPSTAPFAPFVEAWIAAGVRLLGGCCGTAPGDIAALADLLDAPRGSTQPSRRPRG